ncbi:hypothetical protein E8R41_14560 [Escherichia coli]|nr:hypothetical protein E8R41_14560 [Escherichia coli]
MAYEAVKPTRTHKARRENRSADQLSKYGAVFSLREQARFLDINHDLVIGVFDKLEERVIGARGNYCGASAITKKRGNGG